MGPMNLLHGPRLVGALNAACSASPSLVRWRVMEALKRRVPAQMNERRVPGFAAAIAAGGVIDTFEFGTAAEGTPMTRDSRWRIGSLAKPVTAAVVLGACDRGLMELDEPVGAGLLPFVRGATEDWAAGTTLRTLLSHNAWLECRHVPHLETGFNATLEDALTGRCGEEFAPTVQRNDRACYSGSAYGLVQYVLEQRLARSFEDLASEILPGIAPAARMCHSRTARSCPDVTAEYDDRGTPLSATWTPCTASAGLTCSIESLATLFSQMVSRASHTAQPPLDRTRLMFEPQFNSAFTIGLHARCGRGSLFTHAGRRPGMRAMLLVAPSANLVFAAAGNSDAAQDIIAPLCGLVERLVRVRVA